MSPATKRAHAGIWVTLVVTVWILKACFGVIPEPHVDPLTHDITYTSQEG